MAYQFPSCKICETGTGRRRYRLRQAEVWVCSDCGMHYTNYLDPPEESEAPIEGAMTAGHREFIESRLHHNVERCAYHIDLIGKRVELEGLRVLDVGCGAGLFLSMMRDRGARVLGIDMNDAFIEYASEVYGIAISKRPVEHPSWAADHGESFDVVTLRDVIEHVNQPLETLEASTRLLKPGGLLLVDTPCRDAFFHRAGSLGYRLTFGHLPTFLNALYFNTVLGHKQILSTKDMRAMFTRAQLEPLEFHKIHELSMPHEAYLKRLLRSDALARSLAPAARAAFRVMPIRNKLLAIGAKMAPEGTRDA